MIRKEKTARKVFDSRWEVNDVDCRREEETDSEERIGQDDEEMKNILIRS